MILGISSFPVTRNGIFSECLQCIVATHGTPGLRYVTMGVNEQLHISKAFSKSPDAVLSITSAYEAAISVGFINSTTSVFVSVDGVNIPDCIVGASEGIAMLVAFLGKTMPPKMCATGFVDVVGVTTLTYEQLKALPVHAIDCSGSKAAGLAKIGWVLLVPESNRSSISSKLFKENGGPVIFVSTVGDVLNLVK